MTYDEDPLFLFPENDYTKLVGDSGKDKFALPVFEYFEKSNTNLLYIDLTIISGKVELILKNGRDGKIFGFGSCFVEDSFSLLYWLI